MWVLPVLQPWWLLCRAQILWQAWSPPRLHGEVFGERCEPRCFGQGILVAWRAGRQPQQGLQGGAELGAGLERS